MKKKMKGLLSVGLCLAVGLSVGSLVACQPDKPNTPPEKDPPEQVEVVDNYYYLVGNFSDESLPQATEWGDQHCETVDDVPDAVGFKLTDVEGVYEVTVNLYEDDMFQVLIVGQEWSGQMGYKTFKASLDADTSGNFKVHNSFPVDDIQIVNSGTYKLTLTITDDSKALTLDRTADAPALPVHASEVSLSQTSLAMVAGDEETLIATVTPADAVNKAVTWSSSDDEVATVDQTGKVTAVAEGTATITVTTTDGGHTAECAVVVAAEIVDVESVSIPETLAAHCGVITIEATVLPENATNKAVSYTSSAPTIVSVVGGVITALKPGTATITATAGDGKTDTCEVTVARDYYLRGDMMGWDPAVAALGQEGIIYFTETEAGVYSTGSVAIKSGHQFKIASVGEAWDNQVGADSCDMTGLGAYFEVIGDMGASKFKCKDTRMYTFTLDTTGTDPVITVEVGTDLPDAIDEATGLGAWGDALSVGWTGTAAADKVDFVKGADNKWTATVSMTIVGAGGFQFRCEVDGTTIYIDSRWSGATFTAPDGSGITAAMDGSETNIAATAGAAGTYNATITLTEDGKVDSIVIVAA